MEEQGWTAEESGRDPAHGRAAGTHLELRDRFVQDALNDQSARAVGDSLVCELMSVEPGAGYAEKQACEFAEKDQQKYWLNYT